MALLASLTFQPGKFTSLPPPPSTTGSGPHPPQQPLSSYPPNHTTRVRRETAIDALQSDVVSGWRVFFLFLLPAFGSLVKFRPLVVTEPSTLHWVSLHGHVYTSTR